MNATAFVNVDILSVGVAVAANLILGFIIFFKNYRSATNILFLLQTVVLSIWSVVNYLSYQIAEPSAELLFVRLVMFFAVPNSIIFLLLMHTFPSDTLHVRRWKLVTLIVLTLVTMAVAVSPLLFSSIKVTSGMVPQPVVGPGMLLFVLVAVFSVPLAIYFLIRRYRQATPDSKLQLKYLLVGVVAMFSFILVLDFILPSFFQYTRFIPLSAVFTLPFVAFTFYAIIRHHLLSVKVISTEILTFVLSVAMFFEVVLSNDTFALIVRSMVFLLVLSFGILLIRSVLNEVRQREELQELTGKLATANRELVDLSRFKTQLLSLASHQIKSPLAAIKGFASILIEGLYGPIAEKPKETLGKIKLAADELINLINTLLDMRKVEEGKMDYQFSRTGIIGLVREVVEGLRPLVVSKNVKLELTAPMTEAFVSADGQKLKQVIQNLVDNAIKYTPSGVVHIMVDPGESDHVMVTVADTGLGIALDLLPQLFEEFVRDERVKKEIRGTGLGLYIAHKIVEAHSGRLWAESLGPGQGSRFVVTLKKIA